MVMTREEVFRATGPTSGAVVEVKIGAKKDGTHRRGAAEMLKYQAGAFPGSPVGPGCMCGFACTTSPNVEITGYDVVTNRPKVAAYRAPGAPISTFAVESAMDELARKLGMDPIALREKNAARDGTKTPTGRRSANIGYRRDAGGGAHHRALPHRWARTRARRRLGLLVQYRRRVVSGGARQRGRHGGGGRRATPISAARAPRSAMMAAEVLGMPVEERAPDRRATPASIGFTFLTGGSRVTFATGMAATQAAEKVRRAAQVARRADLGHPAPRRWTGRTARRYPAGANAGAFEPLSLAAIALKSGRTGGPISAEVSLNAQGAGPGFGTHVCDVEVDPETGHVTILRYTAVQDVGKAIHPSYVEGQMQGGAVQGIGWALNEEYIYDKNGRMENPGFLDYRCPVASDLPMIDAILVEVPNPRHPFGAKGVGEVPIVPPMAAVANAIRDAIGMRMHHLPMSPPKVLAALEQGSD